MEDTITIKSASISDRGLSDKRPQNEDSYLEMSAHGIYAVADGVGGAQAGDVASQMAVEILNEAFVNRKNGQDAEDVMRAAALQANSAIHQMSQEIPQLSTMATTLVALHVSDNVATIGHVGDSRLYRFVPGRDIIQETDDHSVVAEEVRAGRMTAEQAANHPAKNVISRALGAESTVDIDLKTVMFSPGTTFLLCSDGVTRHIDDSELEDLLASTEDPQDICERIKALCYERGAEDNLTAVIVRSESDGVAELVESAPVDLDTTVPEDEEQTVSTARSPFDELAAPIMDTDPIVNGNGHFAEETAVTDDSEVVDGLNALEDLERSDYAESRKAHEDASAGDSLEAVERTQVNGPPAGSKLFIAFSMLLVGAAIGAGAIYFWMQSHPVVERIEVPVLQEKSTNVPLTAFEESRREVDKDPARYIAANAAGPEDASDYYLLGRAYLMSGKYWDAKQALQKARDNLATADPADAKTLAAEISMTLAIINSGPAQEAFANDISAYNANIQVIASPSSH